MYSGTCLIIHTMGPGKCVGLYRMLEYSGFILVNRNTLGPYFFVRCHRMSENSGVGLHCNNYSFMPIYVLKYVKPLSKTQNYKSVDSRAT